MASCVYFVMRQRERHRGKKLVRKGNTPMWLQNLLVHILRASQSSYPWSQSNNEPLPCCFFLPGRNSTWLPQEGQEKGKVKKRLHFELHTVAGFYWRHSTTGWAILTNMHLGSLRLMSLLRYIWKWCISSTSGQSVSSCLQGYLKLHRKRL